MDDVPVWLTLAEAAEHLQTTPRHVRELVYRREIAFTRCRRLLRFHRDDLDAHLLHRRVEARRSPSKPEQVVLRPARPSRAKLTETTVCPLKVWPLRASPGRSFGR